MKYVESGWFRNLWPFVMGFEVSRIYVKYLGEKNLIWVDPIIIFFIFSPVLFVIVKWFKKSRVKEGEINE